MNLITELPRAAVDYSDWESCEALYLDDCRPKPNDTHCFKWVVVRSYREFVNYIMQRGMPKFISFDHDLGDEAQRIGALSKWKDFDYTLCTEPTGYDCAKWLVEYCLDNSELMPHFTCHSANPAGAENILHLLNNLQKQQGQTPNGYRTHW